jgi:hypothetical protein
MTMLSDNDQVRELQRVLARQYMRLEQLRIHRDELASDTYAAKQAAKFIADARHHIQKLETSIDYLRRQAGLFLHN